MRSLLLIMLLSLSLAGFAAGQAVDSAGIAETSKETGTTEEKKNDLYGWTDDRGVLHITDSLGNVPKKYRSSARKMEYAPGQYEPVPQDNSIQSGAAADRNEAAQKRQWQQRVREAKQRIANGEARYHELEAKRNELLGQWGGIESGHYEGRAEAEQVEKDMKQVQQEIDAARNDLENTIPDDARKAGVPPGWLRE